MVGIYWMFVCIFVCGMVVMLLFWCFSLVGSVCLGGICGWVGCIRLLFCSCG